MPKEPESTPDKAKPERAGEVVQDEAIKSLRPRSLKEYIGQSNVTDNLKVALTAAQQRGEPLEHAIFHGPPGLGKTTLAHIIAAEMKTNVITSSGPALERPGDLMGIVTNLERGDVLFIDEIHRLPRVTEEFLYPAMEDFQVHFVLDKGAMAKTIKVPLQPFTLVGATTRVGLISAPMRERFGLLYHLAFYSPEELCQVVERSAQILGVPIDDEGALEIAKRSRGTPRIANRLLRRVRDYAQVERNGAIDLELADYALKKEGIDDLGLDHLDRAYLATIVYNYQGGPVGIDALAATLNEETDTLVDMVEPFLLKIGFVVRTPGGRRATEATRSHLKLESPLGGQAQLL